MKIDSMSFITKESGSHHSGDMDSYMLYLWLSKFHGNGQYVAMYCRYSGEYGESTHLNLYYMNVSGKFQKSQLDKIELTDEEEETLTSAIEEVFKATSAWKLTDPTILIEDGLIVQAAIQE